MFRAAISTLILLGFYLTISLSGCKYSISEDGNLFAANSGIEKQKGGHVFGRVDSTDYQFMKSGNYEWITFVPWGFQENVESPSVNYRRRNRDSIQMREYEDRWIARVKNAHVAGLKVFIKPHLWLQNPASGKWRSDVFPTSEENWELWKTTYREFIMHYATLAEKANAEMFCIGTEFTLLTIEKPEYWESLIKEVRTIYSGKITYAANWYKEFERITFWKQLDYIGIQAYFPLSSNNYPTVDEISKGWTKYIPEFEALSKKYKRKILFTEMGYKSTADSAIEPWTWVENSPTDKHVHSEETQANCYESFFNSIWNQKWFAGVHIWQLRSDFDKTDRYFEKDFTPQGKLAEQVIAKGFESK